MVTLWALGAGAVYAQQGSMENTTGLLSTNLAGRIPGLMVRQESGIPGTGASLWIRGKNLSGMDAAPLVLVDGVEMDIDLVNAEDIKSVTVLKDAASTAVYGVRGANGVILVSTERGFESAPKLSASAQFGVSQPIRLQKMAGSSQWLDYYSDMYVQHGSPSPFTQAEINHYLSGDLPDRYPSVDWISESVRELAVTQKYNVNAKGGTSKVRYYISGSYYDEDGMFRTSSAAADKSGLGYGAFNFMSNLDIDLSSSTVLSFGIATEYNSLNSSVVAPSSVMSHILTTSPVATPSVFSDGRLSEPQSYDAVNPYNSINTKGYKTTATMYSQTYATLAQDFSEIISKGLAAKLTMTLSTANGNILYRYRNPLLYYISSDSPYAGDGSLNLIAKNNGSNYLTLSKSVSSSTVVTVEPSITYGRQFGKSSVDAGIAGTLRYQTDNVPSSYIFAYPYNHLNLGTYASYSYDGKYSAGFYGSYSGSENFDSQNHWGFFPSVALSYEISREAFWESLKSTVSLLKLRASYGKTGCDSIGSSSRRFSFNTTLDTDASGATFGSSAQNTPTGITTLFYGQPGLVMETSRGLDLGIELGLFNMLTVSAVYYDKNSEGVFIRDRHTPAVSGNTTQYLNLGRLNNRGLEIGAEFSRGFSSGLVLGAYGVFTHNHSTVIEDGRPAQLESYQNRSGHRLDQHFGLEAIGLFGSQEEIDNAPVQKFGIVNPGDIRYKDQNGDDVIDSYDIVAIGTSATPETNYGFGFEALYKGFDLSVHCSGASKVSALLDGTLFKGGASDALCSGQIFADVAEGRWSAGKADSSVRYPRMYLDGSANNSQASSWWLRDMSYMRIRNIDLGYSFSFGLRIFASVVNPFTFSSFSLFDPELDSPSGMAYPLARTYKVGLNLKF